MKLKAHRASSATKRPLFTQPPTSTSILSSTISSFAQSSSSLCAVSITSRPIFHRMKPYEPQRPLSANRYRLQKGSSAEKPLRLKLDARITQELRKLEWTEPGTANLNTKHFYIQTGPTCGDSMRTCMKGSSKLLESNYQVSPNACIAKRKPDTTKTIPRTLSKQSSGLIPITLTSKGGTTEQYLHPREDTKLVQEDEFEEVEIQGDNARLVPKGSYPTPISHSWVKTEEPPTDGPLM